MTFREKGTGLGLAIVKKIMDDHRGTLTLTDAPVDFADGAGAQIVLGFQARTQTAAPETNQNAPADRAEMELKPGIRQDPDRDTD